MAQYDTFAQDFSQTRSHPWPEFELFIPQIKPHSRLLDLGCGNGRLRQALTKDIVGEGDYFGFDISEKMLEIARSRYPKDPFFKGNFGVSLPFGSDNFDWVVGMASFHHLLDPKKQQKALSEIYRVLKPGGHVFLTTWVLPQKYFWRNFWTGRVFSRNWIIPFGKEKHPRTYRNLTHKNLETLIEKAGFEVLKCDKFKDRNYFILAQKP